MFETGKTETKDERPKKHSHSPPKQYFGVVFSFIHALDYPNCLYTLSATQTPIWVDVPPEYCSRPTCSLQALVFVVRNFVFLLHYVLVTSLLFQKRFFERIPAKFHDMHFI